jgi:hypothetical protein
MSHLIQNIKIESVTIENYSQLLPVTLINQIEQFIPPSGSFDNKTLRRYLVNLRDYEEEDANSTMTLANRLRLAFSDMKPDTICGRFPQAELSLKRRLRCVAEYLIRAKEFDKVKDEAGNLIKKRGVIGKLVCIYQPLPKLLDSLQKQGFPQS